MGIFSDIWSAIKSFIIWLFGKKINDNFPIRTGAEVKSFAYKVLNIECKDDSDWEFETNIDINNYPDEFGYVGNRITNSKKKIVGYIIYAECKIITERDEKGRPLGGTFAFRLEFDPNNGWIKKQHCNPEYVDCSGIERIDADLKNNPDYENYLKLI